MKKRKRTVAEEDKNHEISTQLTRMVNDMSFDYEGVAQQLSNQHRTLQQNFTRLCVAWLEQLSEQKKMSRFDLRNEGSVNLGEEFMKIDARKRYLSHV